MQDARVELEREFLPGAPKSLGKLRLSLGYSQQQLAAAIGTSQPHIARIESGRGSNLMLDTAARLASALGVSIDEIWSLMERARAMGHD
jgi:transcriptional regulator with XRE-family HTH domain